MGEEERTLQLTITEINLILQSLGQGQFVQVVGLISKIKTQAESQNEVFPKDTEV